MSSAQLGTITLWKPKVHYRVYKSRHWSVSRGRCIQSIVFFSSGFILDISLPTYV
jgi:hypothetical protein